VLAEGIVRLLTAVADGSMVVLVLEDLHWADQETLSVLEYLADALRSQPVLCVATVRPEETSPARRMVGGLLAARTATVLELGALTPSDLHRMTAACLEADDIPHEVVEYVRTWSDGLPFMIEEVLAGAVGAGALAWDGERWSFDAEASPSLPATFVDNVHGRLRALGPDRARVLRVAAVLGRRFDWELLSRAAQVTDVEVMAALRAGVDAQLLVAEPGGEFRFRHALTRDAVLDDLLPAERALASRAVLDVVETTHAGLPGEWCEIAAGLAEHSGDRERAASLLLELGRRSLAAGALGSAEGMLDRARSLTSDGSLQADVDEVALEVLALAGKIEEAIVVGSRVADKLRILDGPAARRAHAHLGVARAAVTAARWTTAEEHLRSARQCATTAADDDMTARVDTVAADAALGQGEPAAALPLAERALATAEALGDHELACEALEVVGRCWRLSDAAASERAFDRARVIAEANELALWRARAMTELGFLDTLTDRGDDDRLRSARQLALACGAWAIAAHVDLAHGQWFISRHQMEAGLSRFRRCGEVARRLGMPLLDSIASCSAILCYALLGDGEAVERSARSALASVSDEPGVNGMVWAGRAMFALIDEDRDLARDYFARAAVDFARLPTTPQDPTRGVDLLLTVVDEHDPGRAVARVAEAERSDAAMTHLARGHLRIARAVSFGRAGRRAEAEAALAEAEDWLASSLPWLHHGYRLAAPAALQDGWGDPTRWLLEALAGFEARGLARGADACRALLRGAGVAVPRRRHEDPDLPDPWRVAGVTAREAEVLTLLGVGLTNREIAERVFLSPRTVERHLANIGVKVGTGTRSELVAYAARLTAG
jgi:DNA-binding CsgD family transcriptional regulator